MTDDKTKTEKVTPKIVYQGCDSFSRSDRARAKPSK
jgi:hypothetical protein